MYTMDQIYGMDVVKNVATNEKHRKRTSTKTHS